MQAHDDLPLLIDAAREAGEIALRHWKGSPEVWEKEGGLGPVTEADLEVNVALHAHLKRARPDYGWLSEETEDDATRLSRKRCFIIDPIDGTRGFIEGSGSFAHSIAVAEEGEVIAGVVFLPAKDRLFAATKGAGATLNGTPIAATSERKETRATLLATRPNFDPQFWPGGLPPVKRSFRSSLAYRLALVAEGRFDGMITLRDTWEWDIAAGSLIAAEAGATVTDRDGAPLRFNTATPKRPGTIAAGPALHAKLMARRRV